MSGGKPQVEVAVREESKSDVVRKTEGKGPDIVSVSEAEVRSVLDSTEDGLLISDTRGRVVLATRRFGEIWGLGVPERGALVSEVTCELRRRLSDPGLFDEAIEVPSGCSRVVLELEDGRVVEWSRYAFLLSETSLGVAWSFRDVTNRAELEGQLRQTQTLEAVEQLASGVAHEFNNVLFTISSACELALLRGADEQAATSFKRIHAATQRAVVLTRQLAAFAHAQVLNVRILDLNQVIVETHTMIAPLIADAHALRLELGERLGPVRADKSQIEQVLLNLVVNARDATPEGGVITIRTEGVMVGSSEADRLPGLTVGPHVVLTVADEGEGISDEVFGRIFEPFFSTKGIGKGTGMGLSTVFGIVKQHNGAIQVDTRPGRGTQFRVFLPLAEVL